MMDPNKNNEDRDSLCGMSGEMADTMGNGRTEASCAAGQCRVNTLELRPDEEDSMPKALDFVEDTLTEAGVPMKTVIKMNIAVDEIYSNIIRYSGAKNAKIECAVHDGMVMLVFDDNGKPYNPLEAKEPDIELSAEERQIGGLGIFMVRKSMDDVAYDYRDQHNILTLYKKL